MQYNQYDKARRPRRSNDVSRVVLAVLKDLGIDAGQYLTLTTTADGKIVLTPKRKYVLANMIAQCDLKASAPADLSLWDMIRPMGAEVL